MLPIMLRRTNFGSYFFIVFLCRKNSGIDDENIMMWSFCPWKNLD